MIAPAPAEHLWWLASRASGVVGLILIAVSVILGLALAGRAVPRGPRPAVLARLHQHTALAGLVTVAVHAITLMGDPFLHPSPAEVVVPMLIDHEPVWVALGIGSAYLAALLGLSFYARRRFGARRWRSMHRATIAVYVLAVAHVLGAGTDAGAMWMQALLVATGIPVLYLAVVRVLPRPPRSVRSNA